MCVRACVRVRARAHGSEQKNHQRSEVKIIMDTNNNIDLNFPPSVLQDVFRRQTITGSPFHLHPYFYDFMDECLSLYFIFILLYMAGEINFLRIQTSNEC